MYTELPAPQLPTLNSYQVPSTALIILGWSDGCQVTRHNFSSEVSKHLYTQRDWCSIPPWVESRPEKEMQSLITFYSSFDLLSWIKQPVVRVRNFLCWQSILFAIVKRHKRTIKRNKKRNQGGVAECILVTSSFAAAIQVWRHWLVGTFEKRSSSALGNSNVFAKCPANRLIWTSFVRFRRVSLPLGVKISARFKRLWLEIIATTAIILWTIFHLFACLLTRVVNDYQKLTVFLTEYFRAFYCGKRQSNFSRKR